MKKYCLIYAGSMGEPLWVLAARVGVTIIKGREGTFSVEADGNPNVSFCCFLISSRYENLTFSTLLCVAPLTLTFSFTFKLTGCSSSIHLRLRICFLDSAVIAGLSSFEWDWSKIRE